MNTTLTPLSQASSAGQAELTINQWFSADSVNITRKTAVIPDSLADRAARITGKPFLRKSIDLWSIQRGNQTLGFAVLDHTMGKIQPITYLALLDSAGTIQRVTVLQYREAYGGQIRRQQWLRQFTGKNAASSWKVGRDIDGISGATISVIALTTALHRLVLCFPFIRGVFNETT